MKIVKKRGGFLGFGESKTVKITSPEPQKSKHTTSTATTSTPKTHSSTSQTPKTHTHNTQIVEQSKLSSKIKKELKGAQTLQEKKIYVQYALDKLTAKKNYYNAQHKNTKSRRKQKEKTELESFQKTLASKIKEQENVNKQKIPSPVNNTNKPKPDDFLTNYGKITQNYELQLEKHNKLKSNTVKKKTKAIDEAEFKKEKKLLILKYNMPISMMDATGSEIERIAKSIKLQQAQEEARKKANTQGTTLGYTPGYRLGYPGYPGYTGYSPGYSQPPY